MAEPITAAVSDRICNHMNQDHAEAILMYAQVYGDKAEATSAVMDSIDSEGMNLTAIVGGSPMPVRVEFDHTLAGAEDAHHTLVDMLKQARSAQ